MDTLTLLMVVSVLAVVALFVVLAVHLVLLVRVLGAVGGAPDSLLAKVRMGLRAIEVQTGGLAPRVTELNGCLGQIRDGLVEIDGDLEAVIESVTSQEAA